MLENLTKDFYNKEINDSTSKNFINLLIFIVYIYEV